MHHRPTPLDILTLLGVSLLWGSSFMFIKIALKTFGPLSLASSRIVLAGLFLYVIARVRGERFPDDAPTLKRLAAMGLCGTAPFVLITWAQQTIDSSTAAIVMAFAPLLTLTLAHFTIADEKLGLVRVLGLGVGLAGVFVLFGGVPAAELPTQGFGMGLVFIGTVFYAIASVLIRKLVHVSALVTAASFLGMSSLVIFPLAALFDPPWQREFSLEGAFAVFFLGVFSSGLASLLLITLIKRAGVTFSSGTNYLVPLVAVFLGVLLLGEQPGMATWIALLLIFAGLGIANFAPTGRVALPPKPDIP
jgi:drug/metabolite transporter (DMT)-like permease